MRTSRSFEHTVPPGVEDDATAVGRGRPRTHGAGPRPSAAGAGYRATTIGRPAVLSIGAVTTASLGYYQREVARGDGVRAAAYYQQESEPTGQWIGAGAAALGLHGPLADGDLATLLSGA